MGSANVQIILRFNEDAVDTNYTTQNIEQNGATITGTNNTTATGIQLSTAFAANVRNVIYATIAVEHPGDADVTANRKLVLGHSGTSTRQDLFSGQWLNQTDNVTSITIRSATATAAFDNNSTFTLYRVRGQVPITF